MMDAAGAITTYSIHYSKVFPMTSMSTEPAGISIHDLNEQAHALFLGGVALHRENLLEQAMQAYEKVLRMVPGHVGALHHVGIIAIEAGSYEGGAGFLRSALAINAEIGAIHVDLGNAYKQLGQFDLALASYDRALALDGASADLHYSRGNALQALRRFEEALHEYEQALAMNPHDTQALNNRGVVLRELGRFEQALASYDRVLMLTPHCLDALNNRGNVLKELRRFDEALASFNAALFVDPASPDSWFNRGVTEHARGDHDDALASYGRAIDIDANFAQAYHNRSTVLHHLKRYDDALADCQQAIKLKPDYQEAYKSCAAVLRALKHFDTALGCADMAVRLLEDDAHAHDVRGTILKDVKRLEDALAAHERAIELEPRMVSAYQNLANVLRDQKRFAEAEATYTRAIELDNERPESYLNRGTVYAGYGDYARALADYDAALALDPRMAGAYWNRSLLHLEHGNFRQGWIDHEWRWKTPHFENSADSRNFMQPQWRGQALNGKTILLSSEQGFGDTIQCSRFATLLAARGATVIMEVQRGLVEMLSSIEGVSAVVARGDELPRFDYWCPMMSVPMALAMELEDIPAPAQYLRPDSCRMQAWAQRLGPQTQLRVGLVWSGNPTHGNDVSRSILFAQFMRMLPIGPEYVSLMKDVRDGDLAALGERGDVTLMNEHLHDFSDTAALCALMDVVVSVDTSVAHLAAALGRPTWILLPAIPDWRWLRDRRDSPWYPAVTLYRQRVLDDWSDVREEVHTNLQSLARG
jgi:tetratricopeptide (TPR) repeat protein